MQTSSARIKGERSPRKPLLHDGLKQEKASRKSGSPRDGGFSSIGIAVLYVPGKANYRQCRDGMPRVKRLSAGADPARDGSSAECIRARKWQLVGYFQSKAFADNPLDLGAVIPFRIPGTQYIAHGYEARPSLKFASDTWRHVTRSGSGEQKDLAVQAEIVIRSCAKVGIIALIDEATGYLKFKKKQEYQLKLQAFIADELQDLATDFPDEFWYELARLEGIHYSPRSRPLRWGKYVMMFVYDAVDGDVGKELRRESRPAFPPKPSSMAKKVWPR